MTDSYDYISPLPENVRAKVAERMTRKALMHGEPAYRCNDESDALYQIISGEIRILNVSREGKEVLYLTYHEGDCFGDIGLLDNKPRAQNAIANGPTVLAALKKQDFDELRTLYPELIEQISLVLCQRLHLVFGFFESSALLPLSQRLSQRILDLARQDQHESGSTKDHEINLAQSDLAHMMGVSRQAIGKILKDWEEQGLIKLDYRKLTVIDINAFANNTRMIALDQA